MLAVHVAESYKTVLWLAGKGHRWIPNFGPRAQFLLSFDGGGFGLQERNYRIVEQDGATIHYETAATELLQDDKGAVIGVRALGPSGFTNFYARSVVLAGGGVLSKPVEAAGYAA